MRIVVVHQKAEKRALLKKKKNSSLTPISLLQSSLAPRGVRALRLQPERVSWTAAAAAAAAAAA